MNLFLSPETPEEEQSLEKVSTIVQQQYANLYAQTSSDMQKELKSLVVRTMWDSSTRNKYGEYYGVPAPKQRPYDTGMMPSEIVIFAQPLVQHCPDNQALEEKIKIVLIHEIGHYLGLSEEELRDRKLC